MSALSRFAVALAATVGFLSCPPAHAWDRGSVENFATIPLLTPSTPGPLCPTSVAPPCASDIEGVAVGPDGTVYSAAFGFNSEGGLGGNGELFVFSPNGTLLNQFPVIGSSPQLIGMVYQQSSRTVLIADLDLGIVWKVDPKTGKTSKFVQVPTVTTAPGLNALTIDKAGNVYVSDSFQGAIWKTDEHGDHLMAWYAPFNSGQTDLLLPNANTGEVLIPPFGANGIEFNNEGTAMFAMNTAYHSIVKILVNPDGSAGTAATFTTGINAPDGLAVDGDDNLWVAANQGDEIVVVDPNGKVIAKKGDFNGIADDGSIQGLLFPASLSFSPDKSRLYVTNLALYLPFAGVHSIAVDSGWTLQVEHYNIAVIDTARAMTEER
jgi:sugar lactone lactonase YvrE